MDRFIDFLEEYKSDKTDDQDLQTIADFKEKINKPIEYKLHLDKFEFVDKWFEQLDYILIELGYRALDADIKYIVDWLVNKLTNTIHINKINPDYDVEKLLTNNRYLSRSDNLEILTYLITNPYKIRWYLFSQNASDTAVKYLLEHPDKIKWDWFSSNKSDIAVRYLLEHPDKIDWYWFSSNKSDIAVKYLLEHPDKIDWVMVSCNAPDIAVKYLLEHPDKIDWVMFSYNASDIAVKYLLEHPDKIDWVMFSYNASDITVKYLLEHPDKINWDDFRLNDNILAIKYCVKNNKPADYKYLLIVEKICADKITSFNKLNWFPKSKLML